jgi:hypothetical protein
MGKSHNRGSEGVLDDVSSPTVTGNTVKLSRIGVLNARVLQQRNRSGDHRRAVLMRNIKVFHPHSVKNHSMASTVASEMRMNLAEQMRVCWRS